MSFHPQNSTLNTRPLTAGPADVRQWIQNLRQQHGDILNAWPAYAVQDFIYLRRELLRLEATRYDRK